MTFAEYLRAKIAELETNVNALAKVLNGVPQPTLHQWAKGARVPPAYVQTWVREKLDNARVGPTTW